MNAPPFSFVATVDESGHESDDFTKGGAEWFVLSAVLHRVDEEVEALSAISELRDAIRNPVARIKYQKLRPKHQIHFARSLAGKPVQVISVIVHKPSLRNKTFLADSKRMYAFVGKFLLERISWACRDLWAERQFGNGRCAILFSRNRRFSYADFRAYVQKLHRDSREGRQFNTSIAWRHVNHDLIFALDHEQWRSMALADLVASATGHSLQYTELNVTDDRAVRELAPVTYRANNRHFGYGVKLWPKEAEQLVQADPRLSWLRHYYD